MTRPKSSLSLDSACCDLDSNCSEEILLIDFETDLKKFENSTPISLDSASCDLNSHCSKEILLINFETESCQAIESIDSKSGIANEKS